MAFRCWTEIGNVTQVMWIARLISHDAHVFSSNAITTVVFLKLDLFLQHHYQLIGFCMFLKEFFHAVELVNTFPSSSCKRFHVGGENDIIKDAIPIQGISKIGK